MGSDVGDVAIGSSCELNAVVEMVEVILRAIGTRAGKCVHFSGKISSCAFR